MQHLMHSSCISHLAANFATPTDRDLIADVALVFGRNQAGFGSAFLFLSQSRRGLCDSSRAAAAVFWCLSLRHFLRGVALQVLETRVERLLRRHSTFLTFQRPSSLSPTPFKSPRRCSQKSHIQLQRKTLLGISLIHQNFHG